MQNLTQIRENIGMQKENIVWMAYHIEEQSDMLPLLKP